MEPLLFIQRVISFQQGGGFTEGGLGNHSLVMAPTPLNEQFILNIEHGLSVLKSAHHRYASPLTQQALSKQTSTPCDTEQDTAKGFKHMGQLVIVKGVGHPLKDPRQT